MSRTGVTAQELINEIIFQLNHLSLGHLVLLYNREFAGEYKQALIESDGDNPIQIITVGQP